MLMMGSFVLRRRPSVHVPAVRVGLEQLRASQRRPAAVPRPGRHVPGAALSQSRLCGPLLRQRGKCCKLNKENSITISDLQFHIYF